MTHTTVINTREEMRAKTHELVTASWTLAAMTALFESGLAAQLTEEPRTVDELTSRAPGFPRDRLSRCLRLLAVEGVVVADSTNDNARYVLSEGARAFVQDPMRSALQGEMRSALMQTLAYANGARAQDKMKTGWHHVDRDLLLAQGAASGGFPPMFKAQIVPQLGDLASRLEKPGARFLDVGVGVAKLAISMAQIWPSLHVVGLDVFDVPLAIARENVDAAGLASRIELRRCSIEDHEEASSFDVAWLPVVFMPEHLLENAVSRVRATLRPGGWVLCALLRYESPDGGSRTRSTSVNEVLTELWGGPSLRSPEMIARLERGGFKNARAIEGPPWAPVLVVAEV